MHTTSKLLVAVTLFALVILSVEGLLRLAGAQPSFAFDWKFHPLLGHTGPPSSELKIGKAVAKYNEMGFRSDWIITPPPDQQFFSLLILGDSMTEQNDLNREETYSGQISTLFPGKKIRVHTFAVADYGTAEALAALKLYGEKAKPDLIFLQFLGLNDYVNNNRSLAGKNKSWSDFSRPYFDPESQSLLTPDQPWRQWLLEHSLIFHMAYAYFTAKKWDQWMTQGIPFEPCSTELRIFLHEPGPEWQVGLNATIELLKGLKAAAGNTPVVGAYFASNIELDDGIWEKSIEPEIRNCFPGMSYDRYLGEKRFIEFAKNAGFDLAFSLWKDMKDAAGAQSADATLFIPGGHFSPAGHKIAARLISRKISGFMEPQNSR